MIVTFCLRLAAGMLGVLLLLDPAPIPPRFFRVQHLVGLVLLALAFFFAGNEAPYYFWALLTLAMLCCFAGSVSWHTEEARGGPWINAAAAACATAALVAASPTWAQTDSNPLLIADNVLSAALLGSALTAMLMGHSYLIAPAMTMSPLLRLLAAFGVALGLRLVLACVGLWQWTAASPSGNLETETFAWLIARWLVGFIVPAILGWMAWETARLRSTQSATGILYVVVILVFLGELTSLLLVEKTRFLL